MNDPQLPAITLGQLEAARHQIARAGSQLFPLEVGWDDEAYSDDSLAACREDAVQILERINQAQKHLKDAHRELAHAQRHAADLRPTDDGGSQ